MKKIIVIILLSISHLSYGHETYYAFAEMEYDTDCSCLEISITVSSHDLNTAAENLIQEYPGLEKSLNDAKKSEHLINNFIFKGFEISQNSKPILLSFEGFELLNDGNCLFYFKSEKINLSQITVRFDLFMNEFNEQQNKLIFIKSEEKTEPYNFFIFRRQTEIKL